MPLRMIVVASALGLAFLSGAGLAIAQTMPPPPKPGPEVKKLAELVGKFTNNGDIDAGVMGPNPGKMSGIDDCKWAAGGFVVFCNSTFEMGGMKGTGVSLTYYDSDTKMYHYDAVDSTGVVEHATGTLSGDTWTWNSKGKMGDQMMYTRFIMKMNANGFDWTMAAGPTEDAMKEGMRGKNTRVTMTAKTAESKPSSQ